MLRQAAAKRKALNAVARLRCNEPVFKKSESWRDPTEEEIQTVEFEAIWQAIKKWDINVPEAYRGYTGAMGNHVCAILDALKSENLSKISRELETKRLNLKNW